MVTPTYLIKLSSLLKASSIIDVYEVGEVRKVGGSTVPLPYTFRVGEGATNLYFEVEVPRVAEGEVRLLTSLNVEGTLLIDGSPYAPLKEGVNLIRVPPGRHKFTVRLSSRNIMGEIPEEVRVEEVVLLHIDPSTWELATIFEGIAELSEALRRRGLNELSDKVLSLAEKTFLKLGFKSLNPAQLKYYVKYFIPKRVSWDLRKLYNEAYWISVKDPQKLKSRGFTGPQWPEFSSRVKEALRTLLKGLEELRSEYGKVGTVYAVGHSHLDAAWLWGFKETREKVLRVVLNALRLREVSPLTFAMGSSAYYEWLEEISREVFREVLKAVSEGWWLPVGGAVVEPDVNLPSGETIVRNLTLGQEYFSKVFGKPSNIAWLPDTFGFSGNLPQILRKSGLDYLVTHKLDWMRRGWPYTVFKWVGVDGTEILVYNVRKVFGASIDPERVLREWEQVNNKESVKGALILYGYGDGGQGPDETMLIKLGLIDKAPHTPKVVHGRLEDFLRGIDVSKLPEVKGELLLDVHTGTYTSNAEIKQVFREAERSLINYEVLESLSKLLRGSPLRLSKSRSDLKLYWVEVIMASFHDVITGTSKYEVYSEVVPKLRGIAEELEGDVRRALTGLLKELRLGNYLVFNPTQWSRLDYLELPTPKGLCVEGDAQLVREDGGWKYLVVEVEVPGYSLLAVGTRACEEGLEKPREGLVRAEGGGFRVVTEYFNVLLDSEGRLVSVRDAVSGQEFISRPSGYLIAYFDLPDVWEVWDLDPHYLRRGSEVRLCCGRVVEDGPLRSKVRFEGTYGASRVAVTYTFYRRLRRIDIEYEFRWLDKNILLKAWFHPRVKGRALFQVPYGTIERQWPEGGILEYPLSDWLYVDYGSSGLGIASRFPRGACLMPDGSVGVSLLKSAMQPNPFTDTGEFRVKLALIPVTGGLKELLKEFKTFSNPLVRSDYVDITNTGTYRTIKLLEVNSETTVLEAVVPSEDGFTLRLVNYGDRNDLVSIKLPVKASSSETNLVGTKDLGERSLEGLRVGPREIKSVRVRLRG